MAGITVSTIIEITAFPWQQNGPWVRCPAGGHRTGFGRRGAERRQRADGARDRPPAAHNLVDLSYHLG